MYKQGEPANMIYIAHQGEFESVRMLKSYISNINTIEKLDFKKFIGPKTGNNFFKVYKMKKDTIPKSQNLKISLINQGTVFGLEDIQAEREYSVTVKCHSPEATCYSISRLEF